MPCPYSFEQLKTNFPAEDRKIFFKNMGWDDLIDNVSYENTCAMRVSTCLVKLGMSFPEGQIKILKGEHSGKRVEITWKKLNEKLTTEWGNKESIDPPTQENCKPYQGVILFETLPPDTDGNRYPGHIDVLDGPSGGCLYRTYFGSEKIGVWPAKKSLFIINNNEAEKQYFIGYINDIDVDITSEGKAIYQAFMYGEFDNIQVSTNSHELQRILELSYSQKNAIEVWYVRNQGINFLTRIRILAR
jgi:hypothetical protein